MFGYLYRNPWIAYVALAGLAWGTYVPLIFYGGGELGAAFDPPRPSARMLAILCVGVAYFLIGVLYPLYYLLQLPEKDQPEWTFTGLLFSGLAGVAGAAGAICVVFGTGAALGLAREQGLDKDSYKVFIAPLIFGLAPVINTLVSIFWHPKKGEPLHFGFTPPNWLLWVGIVLVGLGAGLVLYSKELGEAKGETASLLDALSSGFSGSHPWLLYVALAGLAWGTYVPLIFYGGGELGGKPSSRFLAILCVGVAYFLCAIVLPGVALWQTPAAAQPQWDSVPGLAFAGLAGAAGAIGAICVIFATKSAIDSAREEGRPPATYKLFIAPLIFGLAPVINTLVSVFWHPEPGSPLHFGLKPPHPLLWLGILAVGAGAALVLYSKELAESASPPKPPADPGPEPHKSARRERPEGVREDRSFPMTRPSIPAGLSIDGLFGRYLEEQALAHAEGLGHAESAGDAGPHDTTPVQPTDPRLAWADATSALSLAADVPPEWATLVNQAEPAVSLAFALGNYPQQVRHVATLLMTDPATLRESQSAGSPRPDLVKWAQQQGASRLLAAGVLRQARLFAEAEALLSSPLPEPLAAVCDNERAALLWHCGQKADAAKLWESLPESVPVLFNRGMARLFTGDAAGAREPLAKAQAALPETSAWHHLAGLYLAMASGMA